MKKTLKLLIVLVIINILIVGISFMLGLGDMGTVVVLIFSSIISLVILVITFFLQLHTSYSNKNPTQKSVSRKRGWIITVGIVVGALVIFVVASFMNGYKIPQWDKHKDWGEFPKSSNPDVVIDSIKGLFITNIDTAPESDYYFVHFTSDTPNHYDAVNNGSIEFGIMDKHCKMKIKYTGKVSAYLGTDKLFVLSDEEENDSVTFFCDVYDTKTLKRSRQEIHFLDIPVRFEYYPDPGDPQYTKKQFYEKYRSDFFDTLKGVKSLDENAPSEDNYRGYILYTDNEGKLYRLKDYKDNTTLDVLCAKCYGFQQTATANYTVSTKNIVMLDESILWKNDLNSGLSISYGNPNGGGNDGFYFNYYHTWLMYYTVHLGTSKTSFKAEGGGKDKPYLNFLQLNQPKYNTDTLYFAADNKLWRVYNKK